MANVEDTVNEDKKEIGEEEREKMLNEENKKDNFETDLDTIKEDVKEKIDEIKLDCEVEEKSEEKGDEEKEREPELVKTGEVEKMKKQLEESEKEGRGIIRVPIGGIKIPGFLRSLSRDKNKEGDCTLEEGSDLLNQQGKSENGGKEEVSESKGFLAGRIPKIKIINPFGRKVKDQQGERLENQDDSPDETGSKRKSLIDTIKKPLVAVLPKTFTRANKEEKAKDGEPDSVDLASMETLEDSKECVDEDGMVKIQLSETTAEDANRDPEKAQLEQEEVEKNKPKLFIDRIADEFYKLKYEHRVIFICLLIAIFILFIVLVVKLNSSPPTSPPVINGKIVAVTSCGHVEGLQEDDAFVFRGIPYTVPPSGKRRFQESEHISKLNSCWNGTFLAHNKTLPCWQLFYNRSLDGIEDCLTLDVFTPAVRYDVQLPVVVLIGSDTLVGGSPNTLQPTAKLAKMQDVLFVRPNFRLGVLGFLASNIISTDTYPHRSGNYGLSDILSVLQWVKHNIIHFGGSPKLVTILGHRAGATLVTALSSSTLSKRLFERAWVASGSAIYPGNPLHISEKNNEDYVHSLCPRESNKLECLRNYEAEELIEATPESWRPRRTQLPQSKEVNDTYHEWLVLDGHILKEHVWGTDGLQAKLVIGTTVHSEANPGLWEQLQKYDGTTEEAIAKYIRSSRLGDLGLAEEALRRYNSTWQGLTSLVSDIRTICPLLTFVRAQSNVSFYVATVERNYTDFGQIADVDSDVSAILGTYAAASETQRMYVSTMQHLFYEFVRTGQFKPLKQGHQGVLKVGQEAVWQEDYPNCDFWISKDIVPRYARRD